MNLAPRNASLAEIASRLAMNLTARVVIEPGDMTRYEFYLIPMGDPHLRSAGTGQGHFMISIVTPHWAVHVAYPVFFGAGVGDHTVGYLIEHMFFRPEHTQTETVRVIVGFLKLLWDFVHEGIPEDLEEPEEV